ncbi:D-ser-dehydrat domain-containing protein [Mycena venus]|uniref:D-ser-dehydrat domain-containing protein n=1 Tax=Mycena venus TaxID=2733690 RepID=A0A8H7CW74_9AGAR|nr:D-ser-dehydrat domain-containing protein [Mycena venus]
MLPSPLSFQEPPTASSLATARAVLADSLKNASSLSEKINAAQVALAQIVAEAEAEIEDMLREKHTLQETIEQTQAYLSPIRRLPGELLRELFMWCFEGHPCCAWVLSAVCTTWRQQALGIPRIWSKIRLFTNQSSSPDTIRLWLERSGPNVPLDIEIYLRVVQGTESPVATYPRRRRGHELFTHTFVSAPAPLFGTGPLGSAPGHLLVPHFTPSVTPFIVPQPPVVHHHPGGWESPPPMTMFHGQPADLSTPPNLHWGHIAVYYLVQQMHRWERFVFRFDKGFGSIAALKSITGSAPLLKEFEVSSASAVFYPQEWGWLPSSNPTPSCLNPLPNLQTLTLQYAPFKPTSPVFLQPATQLVSINIRALPASLIPLDRILSIINANRDTLKILRLHFASVSQAVLPLPAATTLEHLEELYIGGHHLLSQLIDTLALPQLHALDLDFDAPREPIEETIASLYARSQNPILQTLAISYGPPSPSSSASSSGGGGGPSWSGYYGYVAAGNVVSWAFLAECGGSLEVLKVGGAALEGLLGALAAPEDQPLMPTTNNGGAGNAGAGNGGWACPHLRELHLRGCHSHSHPHHSHSHAAQDGVGKLVRMVDARNPDNGGGSGGMSMGTGTPHRLVRLELDDCVPLGGDVVRWLEGRIGKDGVVCVEPPAERYAQSVWM